MLPLQLYLKAIISVRIKNEIYDNKYFSTTFKELLEKENYFNEVDENYIKEHYIQLDDSATREYPVERINKSIREELYHKFLEEFMNIIMQMAEEKSKEYELEIKKVFLKSLKTNDKEIENLIDIFLKEILEDHKHSGRKFDYLLDRFSRNVFDILILYALGSIDRKNKFTT